MVKHAALCPCWAPTSSPRQRISSNDPDIFGQHSQCVECGAASAEPWERCWGTRGRVRTVTTVQSSYTARQRDRERVAGMSARREPVCGAGQALVEIRLVHALGSRGAAADGIWVCPRGGAPRSSSPRPRCHLARDGGVVTEPSEDQGARSATLATTPSAPQRGEE